MRRRIDGEKAIGGLESITAKPSRYSGSHNAKASWWAAGGQLVGTAAL